MADQRRRGAPEGFYVEFTYGLPVVGAVLSLSLSGTALSGERPPPLHLDSRDKETVQSRPFAPSFSH